MKNILLILTELIAKILPGDVSPAPESGILWVFFAEAKHRCDDCREYANQKSVWVGLLADRLAKYPHDEKEAERQPEITFRRNTAWINPKRFPERTTAFNLSHLRCYELEEHDCQVTLTLPSPKALILPIQVPRNIVYSAFLNGTNDPSALGQLLFPDVPAELELTKLALGEPSWQDGQGAFVAPAAATYYVAYNGEWEIRAAEPTIAYNVKMEIVKLPRVGVEQVLVFNTVDDIGQSLANYVQPESILVQLEKGDKIFVRGTLHLSRVPTLAPSCRVIGASPNPATQRRTNIQIFGQRAKRDEDRHY